MKISDYLRKQAGCGTKHSKKKEKETVKGKPAEENDVETAKKVSTDDDLEDTESEASADNQVVLDKTGAYTDEDIAVLSLAGKIVVQDGITAADAYSPEGYLKGILKGLTTWSYEPETNEDLKNKVIAPIIQIINKNKKLLSRKGRK
jgi:hypothetical protein